MAYKKSYFHRGGDSPLLGQTIPEHFAEIVYRFPNHEALVCIPQHQRLNYSELFLRIEQLARGLIGFGLVKGDRIGIWSTNNLEWVLLQMATARIGVILVTINPSYRLHELEYVLKNSEIVCLFTIPGFKSSDYPDMLVKLIPELSTNTPDHFFSSSLPALRRVVVYDPANPANTVRPGQGFTVWQEILAISEQITLEQLNTITAGLDRDDPINIQYTSGTTGFPKPVLLSHHSILNNAWFSAQAMHFTHEDRLCITVPFYHCFGMVLANLLCFSVGGTAVIACEHFDAEAVLKTIDLERCTAVHGVPAMFTAELEHPNFNRYRMDSLRTGIIAGAPCPRSLMEHIMTTMHCPEILTGYGQTEASPLTHLTMPKDDIEKRIHTVGRNLPHQEVKIVDISGYQTVPLGQVGEICFRGYHLMQGYFKDPEASSQVMDRHGWLHSGDLGVMDIDGYVSIIGRIEEMINHGEENIYPREIEDFLTTHPKIAEVAVFGISDDSGGEEVVAWIQLQANTDCSVEEIKAYSEASLADYKIPKIIFFVDSFPMTVAGKLQKFRMREMTHIMLKR